MRHIKASRSLRTFYRTLGVAFLFMGLGCSYLQFTVSTKMETSSNDLARKITLNLPARYLATSTLVATPVEATTLEPGKFGLAMQELLIASLAKYGATVTEVQLSKYPTITPKDGFTYLTRDAKKIQDKYKAGMVIVSSYIIREHDVILTCRMVKLDTVTVVGASTSSIHRSPAVNKLLQKKQLPEEQLYER